MPKKPTTPFGFIAFGKDGSIRREISSLSANKSDQENEVACRFHLLANLGEFGGATIEQLPENDHDFCIKGTDGSILASVQCIEIVSRDCGTIITMDQFARGPLGSSEHIALSESELLEVDAARRDLVLIEKIKKKLSKMYAKPKDRELWLLIWSVAPIFIGSYIQSQKRVISQPVRLAVDYLNLNGSGPFDRVFYFNMLSIPDQIWPPPTGLAIGES